MGSEGEKEKRKPEIETGTRTARNEDKPDKGRRSANTKEYRK
jgi:hypothetical protein